MSLGFNACSEVAGEDALANPDPAAFGERRDVVPQGWYGDSPSGYVVGTDFTNQRSGSAAAYLSSMSQQPTDHATLGQDIRADEYRGLRVRWSGWMKTSQIQGGAGLWMRVDGPGVIPAFDDMLSTRPITGTGEWVLASVVLDIPSNALGLAFGAVLEGTGDLVVDDFRLEVVGSDVPTTNQLKQPLLMFRDSTATAAYYSERPWVPANLDFESAQSQVPRVSRALGQPGPEISCCGRATIEPDARHVTGR